MHHHGIIFTCLEIPDAILLSALRVPSNKKRVVNQMTITLEWKS